MANKEPEKPAQSRTPAGDEIYKYLGFDVHPGKIGEFWSNEDEKKQYLQKVKASGGVLSALTRDSSILNVKLMTQADRIISYIGSFLLIISFLLPVYSFDVHGKTISGNAISLLLNIPFIGGYAAWDGFMMGLAVLVFTLFVISCPIAGVINLLGLLNKAKGDQYLEVIKNSGKVVYLPMALLILLVLVLIIGAPHPFGSLGIDALGDTLGFGAIFTMTGVGFWLGIAGMTIGFAQSRGI